MNDGRIYTNFESSGSVVKHLMKKNSISNNEEYRKFMTKNANLIMEKNKINDVYESYKYVPNNDPNHFILKPVEDKNHPHLYESIMDQIHPYGYETNPVKSQYLSREMLNAKVYNKYKSFN